MTTRKLFSPGFIAIPIAAATMAVTLACGSDVAGNPTTPLPTVTPSPGPVIPTPFADFHPVHGQPVWLSPGGFAILNGDGARVRFVRVVSDNRCPLNVTCITGGAVTVELAVRLSLATAETVMLWSIGPDSVSLPPGWWQASTLSCSKLSRCRVAVRATARCASSLS